MHLNLKYLTILGATLLAQLANFHSLAQNFPPSDSSDRDRNVPSNNTTNNKPQLPWVLVSQNPTRTVPPSVSAKISVLFTNNGLTPISCSTNPAVIISINNLYVACASPNPNFPPGTYNATIPEI